MACKEEQHQHHSNNICNRGVEAVAVRYRECLKNHAAGFGGIATDGCGEFMPCGASGTLEALKCSVCGCHRNFHRRAVEGELTAFRTSFEHCLHLHSLVMPTPLSMLPPPQTMLDGRKKKKRLRTKFTAEQKQKMAEFADKVGWKLQREEENVLKFCEEIGVERKVFKVWMHNNKNNFATMNNTGKIE